MEVAGWARRYPMQIVFCQGVFDMGYAWWGEVQVRGNSVVWEIIETLPAPVTSREVKMQLASGYNCRGWR